MHHTCMPVNSVVSVWCTRHKVPGILPNKSSDDIKIKTLRRFSSIRAVLCICMCLLVGSLIGQHLPWISNECIETFHNDWSSTPIRVEELLSLLPDCSFGMKENKSRVECVGNTVSTYFLINTSYESDDHAHMTRQAVSDSAYSRMYNGKVCSR